MPPRRSKRDKKPAAIRAYLAENVRLLRDRKYAQLKSATARNRQLAADADMSFSQVQRVLAETLGTSVDYVESMAKALEAKPQDLVTPYFARSLTGPTDIRSRRRRVV